MKVLSMSRSREWLSWRRLRWIGLAASIPALWACNAYRLAKPVPDPTGVEKGTFQQAINRNIDIVFEIDNSVSMAPEQANLVANFPTFINILNTLPNGLPNVHIAVVTSDMGAGAFSGAIGGCGNADNGTFVDHVRAATDPICTTGNPPAQLNAGKHFIESLNGGTQNNVTGNLTDVFRCIAQVGTSGCGFEDHLEAVRAALGDQTGNATYNIPARPIPPNNAGFLRDDAYLAVILITNEEECSTAPSNVLFDPNNAALGPILARCFSHTDICDGQPVINYVQAGKPAGPFQNCMPDETTFMTDPLHGPIPVQFYIDYFNHLKADPKKVLLSGIVAPASPYSLVLTPDPNGGPMVLLQGNSCTGDAGVFGQATPRLTKFFGGFNAAQVVTTSICDKSFAAAMQRIATQLAQVLGSPCIAGTVLNVMGPKGSRPDCVVIDHSTDAQGNQVDATLPSCVDNGNQAPCWNLAPGTAAACAGESVMQFMRPAGQAPPSDLNSSVECSIAVCPAGVHNTPTCP
jgi:hypothetical protein